MTELFNESRVTSLMTDDSIIDRLRERLRSYNERTDYGATQGATLI